VRKGTGVNKTASVVYHFTPWLSLGGSYGDSYAPRTGGAYTLAGDDADPEVGRSYDGVLRLTLFRQSALGGIDISAREYFNRREHILGDPPGKSQFNSLMARNAATDATPNGRNQLGLQDIIGGDYTAQKNKGYEIEVSGRITKGWRMTGSIGTGRIDDYDRWKSTQAYMMSRAPELKQVTRRPAAC
jgi:outer membrane receptor protein involved in Fe transport